MGQRLIGLLLSEVKGAYAVKSQGAARMTAEGQGGGESSKTGLANAAHADTTCGMLHGTWDGARGEDWMGRYINAEKVMVGLPVRCWLQAKLSL